MNVNAWHEEMRWMPWTSWKVALLRKKKPGAGPAFSLSGRRLAARW
jgi:hypothetical protein